MDTSAHSPDGIAAPQPGARLTRREVNTRIVGAAALAALAGLAPVGAALAQPRTNRPSGPSNQPSKQPPPNSPFGQPNNAPTTQPATAKESFPFDRMIKQGTPVDWSLRTSIHLDSFQAISTQQPSSGPGAGTPNGQDLVKTIPFDFKTAAIIFPALASTSTSKIVDGSTTAAFKVDGKTLTGNPTWINDTPGGGRYGKWELRDVKGRTMDMDFEFRCQTWETALDETIANKVPWPKAPRWPSEAATSLGQQTVDLAGGKLAYIDPASPAIKALMDKWTSGKPANSIPPVPLAKFLAGRVLENFQPSGDGLLTSRTGLLMGFNLQGVEATLRAGRGSEHDINGVLCSLYRMAGLPARVVVGYDVSKSQGQGAGLGKQSEGELRSWVEFCAIDETSTDPKTGKTKLAWIPVDVIRMRRSSSKAGALERPWKFFGTNDEADDVIPMAFHFHPPLDGAVSHGAPCLWGWMTTPTTQQASQSIRFLAMTPARSGPKPGGGGGGYK
jgi:hypothetical protein